VFGVDLPDEEAAREMGKQLSGQTGKSVTVRDSKGTVLMTFAPPMKQQVDGRAEALAISPRNNLERADVVRQIGTKT
jgi:hypothetical protein